MNVKDFVKTTLAQIREGTGQEGITVEFSANVVAVGSRAVRLAGEPDDVVINEASVSFTVTETPSEGRF